MHSNGFKAKFDLSFILSVFETRCIDILNDYKGFKVHPLVVVVGGGGGGLNLGSKILIYFLSGVKQKKLWKNKENKQI